jgi:SAM-dependent methyltransferase
MTKPSNENNEKWTAYNKLAWTETTIAPPEAYEEEAEFLAKLIFGRARIPVKTLLHLGCGAGGHDHTLKRHFEITGVDISEGMLEIARGRNPEAVYILGDMRDVRLDGQFDAAAIPDSIAYMATPADLRKAVDTAFRHLKPGGALLITALVSEDFRENNFAYSGSRDGVDITIFENNRRLMKRSDQYEATLVYLIRRGDDLEIETERHRLGLFPLDAWTALFAEFGLVVETANLDHAYDRFLLGEGDYRQRIFVCLK